MKPSFRLALCGVAALPLLGGCQIVAQKAAEVVIKKMGGTVNAKAGAPAVVDTAYVRSLAPLPSGAGLFVCEPVPAAALQNSANWGAGAARWLQVQVAGLPELGQTPLWGVPENARIRLGYADLKLDAKRADALGKSCGISHVAVGTLSGTPAAAILTYQLRDVKSGKVVGTAKISGPLDKLNAQLPALARQLMGQLKLKAAPPTQIALSSDEVAFLGAPRLKATYRGDTLAPAAQARLKTLVVKDPLAGVMAQRWCDYPDDPSWQSVADTLLKQAPNNALVWGETAFRGPIRIVPVSPKLAALQSKYPANYLLAQAGVALERGNRARPQQVSWAEQGARIAPQNSYAWVDLSDALGDQAQSIRRSRYSNEISSADWSKLNALYAKSHAAALQATKVAPADANAWAEVAESATFDNDSAGANAALETAIKLDPRNGEAWKWGMQMTQPKWSGDTNGFIAFATRAASHADVFYFPANDVSHVFESAGQRQTFKGILQTVVAKDPNNEEALAELGAIYHYDDRSYKKAEALYRQALKVNPNYGRAMSYLADLTYWVHNDPKGAEALYKQAIVADPKDGYFHANLGRLYALTGRQAQGVAEANAAKQLGFSDSSHPVWSATGVSAPRVW